MSTAHLTQKQGEETLNLTDLNMQKLLLEHVLKFTVKVFCKVTFDSHLALSC